MSVSPSIASLKKPAVWIPLGLFLFAFLFRLVGVGWGLPNELHNQSYHPDEIVNFGVQERINIGTGKVAPGFYNYGTAYFIALNVAANGITGYGGAPDEKDPRGLWKYIGSVHLAGRIINCAAGAGCVVVVWLIGRRITSTVGALFGAGLVCFAPGFVVHSRFQTVDVFAVFWLALSALFALRILGHLPGSNADGEERKPADMRDAILAGLFAGISTGTKYTGVIVLVVLYVALAMCGRPGWWKAALAGTDAALLAFFITTPGALLDSAKFWADVQFEMGHTASGHGLIFIATPSGFVAHLANLFVGVGLLLTLAGTAGLIVGTVKKHAWAIALLAFAVVYYIVIGRAEVKFLRYIFPLIVPLAVGFGYAAGTARRFGGFGHALFAGAIVALGGLDFGGIAGAVKYTQFMAATDPRDEAALDIATMSRKGEPKNPTVGIVKDPWFWSVPFAPDSGLTRDRVPSIYAELAQLEYPRVVRFLPNGSLEGRQDWDTRLLTELHPDYVVYTSLESADEERLTRVEGLDPGTQSLVDNYKNFQLILNKNYQLQSLYGVPSTPEIHDLMYIRPTVYLWKRKDLR